MHQMNSGDVTDSVYCNVIAALSLRAAYDLADDIGKAPNATYLAISNNLNELDTLLQVGRG